MKNMWHHGVRPHELPMKSALVALSVASFFIATRADCAGDDQLAKALNVGAKAQMTLRIVDDDGRPVADADVEFGFWNNYSQGGFKNMFFRTDTNGECVVSGRCNGSCVWNVTKAGYYRSHAEWSLTDTSVVPNVVNGKWQPYGTTRIIVLKKIVSPVDMKCAEYKLVRNPQLDEWIGFDLSRCAWVKPHGNGVDSDVLLKLHEEGGGNVFAATMELCFTNNPFAGAYIVRKDSDSEMKSVYRADTNASYKVYFKYFKSVDGMGRRIENELPEDSYLVFRTRTKVDDNGNLVSAHYGKIYGKWGFYGGMRAEAFFFNPCPNDTNLEDSKTAEYSRMMQRRREEAPHEKKKRKSFWPF